MLDWPTLLHSSPFTPVPSPTLTGKRILITGAGGSLGSALTLCAHASHPAGLILLDTSENALYQIDRALTEADSRAHTPILGSVTDQRLLTALFTSRRPEIVLHTAAAKHVPLMEQNPFAAIAINALGTLTLVQTAAAHNTARLLLLSTDKAADPISIMGASKRLAELVLLTTSSRTKMTALRLGNVLGTQGSVLPLFEDRIARNLPLPVTHPEATRFFLPLARAVATLLEALAYEPALTPTLLIAQLDRPVRIVDLAQNLLALHNSTLPIEFTGLRPGDKLHETLLSTTEHLLPSTHPTLHPVATPTPDPATLQAVFTTLADAVSTRNLPALLQAMAEIVPEYTPGSILLELQETHA